jgi:hypothetical protein
MERFFSILFYGEHAVSPEVAFEKCLDTEQQNDQRNVEMEKEVSNLFLRLLIRRKTHAIFLLVGFCYSHWYRHLRRTKFECPTRVHKIPYMEI